MNDTSLIPATEFREIATSERGVTPISPLVAWHPIPIPHDWTRKTKVKNAEGEWEEALVPYFVDHDVFSQKTPKHERKRHAKGFMFTTADYARKQLNKAFGNGRWVWHIIETRLGRNGQPYVVTTRNGAKKYIEVIVEGAILAPGMPGPIYGIGSAPWAQDDEGDPRFAEATAQKAASSLALKDAAKRLGIGADISEDESNAAVEGMQNTIVTMYVQLCTTDAGKKAALKIARKYAPTALVGESLIGEAIDESVLDDMLQEITSAVVSI